jgi:protein gp37
MTKRNKTTVNSQISPAGGKHASPPVSSPMAVPAQGEARPTGSSTTDTTQQPALPPEKQKELEECIEIINRCKTGESSNFRELVSTIYRIQKNKLYVGYKTAAEFFKAKFGYSRSHALRLASEGQLIERVSPHGDMLKLFTSDAHLRPLLKLGESQQDSAIKLAFDWFCMAKLNSCSPKLIRAAVLVLNPPHYKVKPKNSVREKLASEFADSVLAAKLQLPPDVNQTILGAFDLLLNKALALGEPIRSSAIDWTQGNWKNTEGCTWVSPACDDCWAAREAATRFADLFPGLARTRVLSNGKKNHFFTGIVRLLPDRLADPLLDPVGKRIFVDSSSDLFHEKVPDEYIQAVYTVMELAYWHKFQVLTKRPERMATFTQERYKHMPPPGHIWMGTTVEDQKHFDERIVHLRNTRAAVRWLSVEPMLGPINFGNLDGIGWVVCGGESRSTAGRQLKKEWVIDARDQCDAAGTAFFFKQWGDFNEVGVKEREPSGPAKLDGIIYEAYPSSAAQPQAAVESPDITNVNAEKVTVAEFATEAVNEPENSDDKNAALAAVPAETVHPPQRIQRSRKAGSRLPSSTVVVTRPTRWGNPFRVSKDYPVDRAVSDYEKWLKNDPEGIETLRAARAELRGKSLACWCRPGEPCHGDVLLRLVNE